MAGVGPVAELRHGASFLGGLRPFLRGATDLPGYARRLEEELADREQTFASTLERAVLGNPGSPYRALFDWAGIAAGDVAAELRSHGLDATLARLHDAGVRATLDEFKGLRPIERPGLSLAVRAGDFDNPAAGRRYLARTGAPLAARAGSSSSSTCSSTRPPTTRSCTRPPASPTGRWRSGIPRRPARSGSRRR
jgi:hypothetical protein